MVNRLAREQKKWLTGDSDLLFPSLADLIEKEDNVRISILDIAITAIAVALWVALFKGWGSL